MILIIRRLIINFIPFWEDESIENDCKKLGARLRQLRQEQGWSQETFAAEARLDRTYVGGIERGERNPSLKNLARLADTLGIAVKELFESTSKNKM